MRKKLDEYLEENGIEAQEQDNDVLFSINQLNFIFRTFTEDPNFVQLILPNVDECSARERREVIAEINRRFKVAKIIEVDDKPWIVADSFVYSNENGKILIGRLVGLLTDVFKEYRNKTSETSNTVNDDSI